jgi:hypothetical protein
MSSGQHIFKKPRSLSGWRGFFVACCGGAAGAAHAACAHHQGAPMPWGVEDFSHAAQSTCSIRAKRVVNIENIPVDGE